MIEQNTNLEDYCTCMCHMEGYQVMHCMPCCSLTYETFLNGDGTLQVEKYEALLKQLKDGQDNIQA